MVWPIKPPTYYAELFTTLVRLCGLLALRSRADDLNDQGMIHHSDADASVGD